MLNRRVYGKGHNNNRPNWLAPGLQVDMLYISSSRGAFSFWYSMDRSDSGKIGQIVQRQCWIFSKDILPVFFYPCIKDPQLVPRQCALCHTHCTVPFLYTLPIQFALAEICVSLVLDVLKTRQMCTSRSPFMESPLFFQGVFVVLLVLSIRFGLYPA